MTGHAHSIELQGLKLSFFRPLIVAAEAAPTKAYP